MSSSNKEEQKKNSSKRRLTWVSRMPKGSAQDPKSWPPNSNLNFDWTLPSNEAYNSILVPDGETEEGLSFTPAFRQAREKLDYSYHKNPTDRRQEFQDVILSRVVANTGSSESSSCPPDQQPRKPRIVFTSGAMGVGKGYVLSTVSSVGLFPLGEYVKIDPDMLKYELPEFAGYLEADAPSAATKLHRESTQMADVLFEYALARKLPLLVDGSLKDVDWYQILFDRLQNLGYEIVILWVTASSQTIHRRAQKRAQMTGRSVPFDLIEESINQVPRSVSVLSKKANATFEIVNEDDAALKLYQHGNGGDDFESCKEEMSWNEFGHFWKGASDGEDDVAAANALDWIPQTCVADNHEIHDAALAIWGKGYRNFCSLCALVCDAQCGVCIHGKHTCGCKICKHSPKDLSEPIEEENEGGGQ
mmetsp:Transcript_23884/g.36920  ORF Transcript_23884/g.36920 Transcript_23884/m.36920 type:complete len:418 (+) Transcript_23884:27-1280(+)